MFYTTSVKKYEDIDKIALMGYSDSNNYTGAYQDTMQAINTISTNASDHIENIVISAIGKQQEDLNAPTKLKYSVMAVFEVNSNGN